MQSVGFENFFDGSGDFAVSEVIGTFKNPNGFGQGYDANESRLRLRQTFPDDIGRLRRLNGIVLNEIPYQNVAVEPYHLS
jgi:hypothetical protein